MSAGTNRLREMLWLLLACSVCLPACAYYFEWYSFYRLFQPHAATGDIPLMCGYFQAYSEGDCLPFVPHFVSRLNAPYTANWADFPTTEELIWLFGGILTRLTDCLTALNLAIIAAHMSAGLCMYVCCRWQGGDRPCSLLAGLVFSTSRFLFVRDSEHINLSFCWHLPLYWVVCRWLWEGWRPSRRHWLWLTVFSLVSAWQHPYFWYGLMVMLVPCWLHPLLLRDWQRAAQSLKLSLLCILSMALANLDTLLSWLVRGRSAQTFARTINELQLYGLRLPELFLPCQHHLKFFDQWAQQNYYLAMHNTGFEMESHYLGLLAIFAVFHLFWQGLLRLASVLPVPFSFGMVCWLVLVSIAVGLNMCAGVFGLLLFRCSCRFSVIILAGALLHLAEWLTRRGTLAGKRAAWLFLLIPLSCLDTMPLRPPGRDFVRDMVTNERAVSAELQKRLGKGSLVFQWPVVDYPEAQKRNSLQPYEQMYLYLFTSNLRFSYGDCRGRSESEWQRSLVGDDKEALLRKVESYGFDAFVLYRTAFTPSELDEWDRFARQPDFRSPWNDIWVYRLHPPARPVVPPMMPTASYGRSFYPQDHDNRMRWNWAFGDSWLDILVPNPCPYRYRFGISAMGSPTRFRIRLDNRDLGEVEAPAEYAVYREVIIDLSRLKPGLHRVRIEPQCSLPNMLENGTRLSFQLVNPTFERLEGSDLDTQKP